MPVVNVVAAIPDAPLTLECAIGIIIVFLVLIGISCGVGDLLSGNR